MWQGLAIAGKAQELLFAAQVVTSRNSVCSMVLPACRAVMAQVRSFLAGCINPDDDANVLAGSVHGVAIGKALLGEMDGDPVLLRYSSPLLTCPLLGTQIVDTDTEVQCKLMLQPRAWTGCSSFSLLLRQLASQVRQLHVLSCCALLQSSLLRAVRAGVVVGALTSCPAIARLPDCRACCVGALAVLLHDLCMLLTTGAFCGDLPLCS